MTRRGKEKEPLSAIWREANGLVMLPPDLQRWIAQHSIHSSATWERVVKVPNALVIKALTGVAAVPARAVIVVAVASQEAVVAASGVVAAADDADKSSCELI
jgi:hypothetical protein